MLKRGPTKLSPDRKIRQKLWARALNAWEYAIGHIRFRRMSIVTAADSTHAKSLAQLVKSIVRHERNSRLYIYDLGLDPEQRRELKNIAPYAIIRSFAYPMYPDWFDIRVEAGQFAWKPVIIEEVMKESQGPVVWMDAGNMLIGSLSQVYARTARNGFYSPNSNDDLETWTHETALAHFGLSKEWARGKRNVNGACVAFCPSNKAGVALSREWGKYARVRQAIAPPGSSRQNHRQDQSLLGILAHKAKLVGKAEEFCIRFRIHCDID